MIKLRTLLIEGRLEDFKKKYQSLPDDVKNDIIRNDPSKNKKYLDWIGRVVYSNPSIKLNDLFKDLKEFDKHQSILGDIYKYKTYDDLKQALSSRQKSNKETKREGANILINNDEFLVVAPTNHDSCRYYGNKTNWCIVGAETWWNDYYYKNSIIIVFDKRDGEKYAVVGNNDYLTVYDDRDHQLNYNSFTDETEETSWPEYVQEAIDDYVSSDDVESRKSEYETIMVNNFIENEGTDEVWENYINRINNENKIELSGKECLESFKNVANQNGLDDEKLKDLAISFLYNQLMDGTTEDDLGKMHDSNELERSLSETWNEPHIKDILERIGVQYINIQKGMDNILEILEKSIPEKEYYKLYNLGTIDDDIFDAIGKYNKILNSKNQLSFKSIGTTTEHVQIRNINDIIYVLKKTGYETIGGYLESLVGLKENKLTPPKTIFV